MSASGPVSDLRHQPRINGRKPTLQRHPNRSSASLDTRYAFRGETVVDGVAQSNSQENLTIGTEVHWLPNSHNSLGLVLAKAVVHRNSQAYTGVVIKYVYSWGKDYK